MNRNTALFPALLLAFLSCKSTIDAVPPSVGGATPAFGPLAGGTIVELTGSGFLVDAAAPDHVLVGGIESPLASVIDDHTLDFVLPPGVASGDAVISVFNQNGDGSAAGIFHYSDQPSVGTVSPPRVLFSSRTTMITVTGSGFQNENAGRVSVLVNGVPAADVEVQSDTQLTFTSVPNTPLTDATVEVVDARGSGSLEAAYRYVPSLSPGLLVFPNDGRTFFTFFDPAGGTSVSVPLLVPNPNGLHIRAVVAHSDGTFLALRNDGVFGVLDFSTQTIRTPTAIDERFPAAYELAGTIYAVSADHSDLVTLDPGTGSSTRLGSADYPCCGTAIAADGSGTLYYVGPQGGTVAISTIDTTTGSASGLIPLTPSIHVNDMRFLGTTLYAISQQTLFTIDPATGSNTVFHTFDARVTAMEVLP